MYKSKKFQMFDYGSPEKNKEHYGNVSVVITLLVASISLQHLSFIILYQAGSVCVNTLVLSLLPF